MEIRNAVTHFIRENFMMGMPNQELNDTDSLLDNGIIDSTGVLELVTFLEDTFDITVEDSELLPENLDSIQAVERFVNRKTLQEKEA